MGSDPIIDPTVHDLFDACLWTIDDNLRIQVAKSDIAESILPGGSHFKLADLHNRPLSFAPQATLRPNLTHLAWHRHHHRKGQARGYLLMMSAEGEGRSGENQWDFSA